jgi:hypothetical protein
LTRGGSEAANTIVSPSRDAKVYPGFNDGYAGRNFAYVNAFAVDHSDDVFWLYALAENVCPNVVQIFISGSLGQNDHANAKHLFSLVWL